MEFWKFLIGLQFKGFPGFPIRMGRIKEVKIHQLGKWKTE